MGTVVAFKKRATRNEFVSQVEDLRGLADRGEMQGLMHFVSDADGRVRISISGAFADRLQLGQYALTKALNDITDRIAASTTAGYTISDSIETSLNPPIVELPALLASCE